MSINIKFLSNLFLTMAFSMVAIGFSAIASAATPKPSDRALELAPNALNDANVQRKLKNLSPLLWSQDLADQATSHSKIMGDTQKLSHDGFADRFKAIGTKHTTLSMAENVAQTYEQADVAQSVTDMWMKSPGHRANLLGNYTYCGISFYQSGGNWYATAIYANW